MSKVVKSPKGSGVQHALSDSDVSNIPTGISTPAFISQRNKRHRQSSEEQLSCFKEEIKSMLDEWKDTQNCLLNKLVAELAEIKKQNTEIKASNEEIEKSLLFMHNQYEEMRKKVESLEGERKQQLMKIAMLESSLEDIGRNSKSSSIELRNIPIVSDKETKSDLCKIVQSTCKRLDVTVQEAAIRDVFRVNAKSGKGTIVAEFTSVMMKHNIIQRMKSYNKLNPNQRLNLADIGFAGQQGPVYISEALTSKGRRLFFVARDVAKTKEYKFCWTSNGKIYLRKGTDAPRIEVKDESQLATLRNQI